ncbi:MAG: Multidrug resistance protein, partial [bacterium]|nr:Multidrug resistance protein [bacterium]
MANSADNLRDAAADDAPLDGALVRVLLIASFGSFLLNLGSTTINVALDKLMRDLDAPLSVMQWIVTGYLLALTLVLPSFRWTVERLGSRRLYVGCLVAFTGTSLLAALAWSAPSLIAFRVLQGAVGGLLAPLTQTLIAQLAGPKRMGRAVSIMSVPVLVAPLLGPVLGGLVVQRLSWRWLFLFNIPFGLAGAWLAQRRLPAGETSSRTPLDVVGLALLSPGIALLTYGLSALGRAHGLVTPRVLVPLAVAVALVAAFVVDARRRPRTALLDLGLFRHRAVSAALVTYLLASVGSFGAQLVLPLYYQQVRGESPTHAGLLIAPQALGMLATLPQVGRLADRIDHGKLVILGVVTTLVGTYAFMQVTEHSSYLWLSLALFVRGAGLGATNTPALAAAYRQLSRDEIPNATTALNVVQRLGAPIGTATMAVALQRFAADAGGSRPLLARAFAHTFTVSAALSGLALFAALALVRSNTQPRSGP